MLVKSRTYRTLEVVLVYLGGSIRIEALRNKETMGPRQLRETYKSTLSFFTVTAHNDLGTSTPDLMREFRRVSHQWSYLIAMRDSGTHGTGEEGPGCVRCPACPQPGINIEENWQDTRPESQWWLVRRYIHFDANFRLTMMKKEKQSTLDSPLWKDGDFFANPVQYRGYLASVNVAQQGRSDCSNCRALSSGSRSHYNKLEVTGVAGGVCRHECAIPQGLLIFTKENGM